MSKSHNEVMKILRSSGASSEYKARLLRAYVGAKFNECAQEGRGLGGGQMEEDQHMRCEQLVSGKMKVYSAQNVHRFKNHVRRHGLMGAFIGVGFSGGQQSCDLSAMMMRGKKTAKSISEWMKNTMPFETKSNLGNFFRSCSKVLNARSGRSGPAQWQTKSANNVHRREDRGVSVSKKTVAGDKKEKSPWHCLLTSIDDALTSFRLGIDHFILMMDKKSPNNNWKTKMQEDGVDIAEFVQLLPGTNDARLVLADLTDEEVGEVEFKTLALWHLMSKNGFARCYPLGRLRKLYLVYETSEFV